MKHKAITKILALMVVLCFSTASIGFAADSAVSGLGAVTTVGDSDLLLISYWTGSAFESKKITFANFKTAVGTGSGSDIGNGTAFQVYHTKSDASAGEWTSTLGATGTRLTMGYFTNLEITNSPTVNGTAISALYQPVNASLTALSGLSSPITVDGNNVTFPGGVITTAANGSRIVGTLDNTTDLTFLTADTYGWYFYNGVPYFNINGSGYKSMYEGLSTGGLIFGDSSPDAAGEIGYDGELKYYDAVGSKTVATVGGALGTPSFTALNMPSSNADPGTTAGQIRHDSTDTGSNSGGTAKWYDGAQVRQFIDTGTNYSLITKYEYMPIRYAEDDDSVTAPAAAAEIGTTSMIARSFAEDADNGVVFFWQIPGDYVSGIKFRVFFATDTNASANETAVFNLSGCAFGSSGAIACSEGTGQESILELTTDEDTGELLVSGWSAAITISGTPATGKIAKLLLTRDVTGGAAEDDMAGHALVTGIEIKYVGKINAFGDY